MIRAALGLTLMASLLGGCLQAIQEVNQAPPLSPVGTGIASDNGIAPAFVEICSAGITG